MARLARMNLPGQPQHVIVRGNNRAEIFCCETDYYFYLDKLQAACKKHDCQIHAYVMMTNHVHLLITPFTDGGLGKTMQMLGRYYVQYFNHCYRRSGTLWEGRYKATLVDSESYLLTCMRYIELNPVRASMVKDPADYPWSSYRCNALAQIDNLVTPHLEFSRLGIESGDCHAAYKTLFAQPLSETIINEIREASNKAWALGDSRFKEQIQSQLARRIEPIPKGGDRKSNQFKFNRV
jgi:putative transposase